MILEIIDEELTICKVEDYSKVDLSRKYTFTGVTDEENSLVCPTDATPPNATERDDGWKGFRIKGVLDFSLIGILSPIASVLADKKIGIFALSTFNTDYILVKKSNFDVAISALAEAGYEIA